MKKDFTEAMAEISDKKLVDILTIKKEDYQPEAILAAEKELEKRKLNIQSFYTEEEITNIKNSEIIKIEDKKLKGYHKGLIIALPAIVTRLSAYVANNFEDFGLIRALPFFLILATQYSIYSHLKNKGYTTLAKEFITWVTYSYYVYIGLFIVIGVLLFVLK